MSQFTISGLVATTPRHLITEGGIAITRFRLAASRKNLPTDWFTVICKGQLAINVASSVHKGERVFVAGDLKVVEEMVGDGIRIEVEIAAEALGHDLAWGSSKFVRNVLIKENTND